MQLIREPTRDPYLLDLCLCDIHGTKTCVLPKIADHKGLLITLPVDKPVVIEMPRKVWHFKGAAWQNLKCALKNVNWRHLNEGSPNDAVNFFSDTLIHLCEKFIPQTTISVREQSHPWINTECESVFFSTNAHSFMIAATERD